MRRTILSIISGTILLFGAFVISSIGIGSNNAHATEAGSDTRVNLNLASLINISNAGTTTMTCDSPNNICTTNASITVKTNNATGYTLQMNTTNGYSNALTNNATSDTVPTLSQSYSSANFPVNHWGYTGGIDKSSETGGYNCALNYCPILAYQSTESNYAPNHAIRITDAPGTSSVTDITFGSKVSNIQPAGTYSTSVTFTAVANHVPALPMQEFDTISCSALSTGDTVTLRDTRDNEEYLIGKLADGNCWMLDNLRLDLTNSTILNSLTPSNTHADSASLTSLKSGNRAEGDQYASSGFEIWDSSHTSNPYNQAKANADYKDTITTSYGAGSGKIGVYYNYCAASAGSYCYDAGAGTGNTQYDICPYNWRMPTGGSSGEYQTLYTAYSSSATNFRNALSTPLSGCFFTGSAYDQGSYGYFWSSALSSAYRMRGLFVGSNIDPSDSNDRYVGLSVRCLIPGSQ